jgi:hypothetical protein
MNKLTNARNDEIFVKKQNVPRSRDRAHFSTFLGEVYFLKSQKHDSLREN